MASKTSAAPVAIELPQLDIRHLTLTLIGDSPLVCHQFSAKAIGIIEGKQKGEARQKKAPKVPLHDFWESLYILEGVARIDRDSPDVPDGVVFGFPATGLKAAAVDACSHIDGVTKVEARGAFHIHGDFVRIDGSPAMRRDMVRIAMGTADVRYRGEFKRWSITVDLRYNANVLTPSQIVNLFNTAGFAIGLGEHRPQRDGSWGMFHVATMDDMAASGE